jgi:hypothetical protein
MGQIMMKIYLNYMATSKNLALGAKDITFIFVTKKL